MVPNLRDGQGLPPPPPKKNQTTRTSKQKEELLGQNSASAKYMSIRDLYLCTWQPQDPHFGTLDSTKFIRSLCLLSASFHPERQESTP